MSDISSIDTVRQAVDGVLREYFAERSRQAANVAPRYRTLWEAFAEVAMAGGKRIRPYLFVIAYEMYGGQAGSKVLRAACAHELLHQALLIHDDVIDRDYVRHGVLNVAGRFDAEYSSKGSISKADSRHLAHSAAILAGDAGIAAAFDITRRSGLHDAEVLQLLSLLDESLLNVIGGQFLDTEASVSDAPADALTVATYKTAYYSFIIPLASGATVAHAPDADIKALRQYGKHLGIAFQLADDLLGVFGDTAATGKPDISDLEEGKRTFMVQHAQKHADRHQMSILRDLLGKQGLDASEADALRAVLTDTGGRQATEDEIARQSQKALACVESLHVQADGKQVLANVVHLAAKRSH